MFDILTHYLDSFLEMGVPGFDCIVFQHGKQIYRHFNGLLTLTQVMKTR